MDTNRLDRIEGNLNFSRKFVMFRFNVDLMINLIVDINDIEFIVNNLLGLFFYMFLLSN